MKCVILAGGTGDSLWPLSRKNYPKQFIRRNDRFSAFQEAITRNIPFVDEFVIVTNSRYEQIVTGQMQKFQGVAFRLFLEEDVVGTAGAIALVASVLKEDEEILLVPSDAMIGQEGYSDAILQAKKLISSGGICLFGISPKSPSTNFGYIEFEGESVLSFIEKPAEAVALSLVGRENVLWNSGVVLASVRALREAIYRKDEKLWNDIIEVSSAISKTPDGNYSVSYGDEFVKNSFERLVLENSDGLSVVHLKADWDDLSDFDSCIDKNDAEANVIEEDCAGTTIINRAKGQLIVANGLRDALVVNTPDAVYISDKRAAGSIREIIKANYADKASFFDDSPLVYRPWGTREVLHNSGNYRVRKLVIYPGMQISGHMHENRNENYTVVSGVLSVELDDKVVEIKERESFNILPKTEHRLFNNTDDNVIAIEVDTGLNIDESDMVISREKLPDLYRLSPAFKDYLWGGTTLRDVYKKASPFDITAESWELSAHPDGTSMITGGSLDGMAFKDFVEKYGETVCGWKSKTFDRFPILIKFIDARNALSVQIHPDDDYALARENEFGKNEMWYVMDAAEGASLYCGLKCQVTKEELRERIANETLTEVLNEIKVKSGDVIFVPAGTIHAIGAGILICEIQQNSNCTYRMFDYGRRDKNGKLRDLHIDKALDVVNLTPYMPDVSGFGDEVVTENSAQRILSRCKYFQVTDYKISDHEIIPMDDSSFKSIVVLAGECMIRCKDDTFAAKAGDSFFVSAGRKRIHIDGQCEVVITNI